MGERGCELVNAGLEDPVRDPIRARGSVRPCAPNGVSYLLLSDGCWAVVCLRIYRVFDVVKECLRWWREEGGFKHLNLVVKGVYYGALGY